MRLVCNPIVSIPSGGRRWSAFALVLGVLLSLPALDPSAFAQPTALWLDESPFTHSDAEFLPGENITIHIEGPVNDIYDVRIVYDPDLSPVVVRYWDDVTVPSGGEIVLYYNIPEGSQYVRPYRVEVLDASGSTSFLWTDYSLARFNAVVLEFLLDLQDEIESLTDQLASLQQNLSLLESDVSALQQSLDAVEVNVTQLQADIDDLQSTLDNVMADLGDLVDDVDGLTSRMDVLEDQIENLQADIADLEGEQDSATDPLTYLALAFGVAGLVIGLLAILRKRPSHPYAVSQEQSVQQP